MLYDQSLRYRVLCLRKHYQDTKLLSLFIAENQQLVDAITAKDKSKAQAIRHESWLKNVKTITEILNERECA
jgi:GntR family carbon starvation induced transcriptional regulator